MDYFGCGRYKESTGYNHGDFLVRRNLDNIDKIIPFFVKYIILGVDALDFADFCKASDIIKVPAFFFVFVGGYRSN
jgi:hypothetical protein